jgi:hypothetical protein
MQKYRITHESREDFSKMEFYIERKRWFGWRRVKFGENGDYYELSFGSYVEAERHIIKNYFRRDGYIYQPRPNEYHYRVITYHGY